MHYRFTLLLATCLAGLTTITPAAAQTPFSLRYSLFDPGTNAEAGALQGYRVAIDGNIAVTGCPHDNNGPGAVKVYDATTGALLQTLHNPKSEYSPRGYNHDFGSSLAISGTRVIVGSPFDEGSGAVYVYDLTSATPTVPVLTLNKPDPAPADYFGWSVAISGSRVVVGASLDDAGAIDSGRVYVYDLASATPTVPSVILNNPSPAVDDEFGYSVGISGTLVVVGAVNDDTGATNAGTAYVYDLARTTPTVPWLVFTNPVPQANAHWGECVAISSSWVVIASFAGRSYAYNIDGTRPKVPYFVGGSAVAISGSRIVVGSYSAAVFDMANITRVASFNNPSGNSHDQFGYSVGISGTRVVIGAPYASSGAYESGSAYVYDVIAGTGPIALNSPSPAINEQFGSSVALSGTRLIVGAPYTDAEATYSGSAYVYDVTSDTPTVPLLRLNYPSPAEQDEFGRSVGISGTRIVVGASISSAVTRYGGRAFAYDLASATPATPVATLKNPTPRDYDTFGHAVAISGARAAVTGGTNVYIYDLAGATPSDPVIQIPEGAGSLAMSGAQLVVGAPDTAYETTNSGSAYVYDLASVSPTVPIATLTSPSPEPSDLFGSSVAIFGSRVVVGAPRADAGAYDAGIVYVYDLASDAPSVSVATLRNPHPVAQSFFGLSVAISGSRVVVGAPTVGTGGSTYVYDLASGTSNLAPVATLKNPRIQQFSRFGNAVAADGPTLVVGDTDDNTNAQSRGAAFVFSPSPRLTIAPGGPSSATISWTANDFPGSLLQFSDSLAPDSWMNAPSGASNPVTVSSTNTARFYRLFSP